ncbi:E2 ubiquitin-conjugating protein UBC1 SCDLUD_003776 [Saccharomycodes ludwigii]|uniref:E2 ubiquitin-conjugating protein UBC1 n=1 Tax=Saccharomycodes ludwigii TaxID=36035 RepID=UPI001E83C993|nr:hypothetical protein SCDLUD_003776 [Saccharomycodes ludwigii]KAH3900771.1 hypothetical protein SCDLUD_003776 [Saccharomycodes ludwigii]
MSMSKRLLREISSVKEDPNAHITLQFVNESDIHHLKGTFLGPPGTPYEGGKFIVDIKVPSDYPFKPPIMKFDTKVYHPNISSVTGAICLDILKNAWSPVITLKSALISLQALLQSPEPNDPQDAEVARHYLSDKESFNKTAALWTRTYAPNDEVQTNTGNVTAATDPCEMFGIEKNLVDTLCSNGFAKDSVIEVLRRYGVKKSSQVNNELMNKIIDDLLKN